ADPSEVRLLNAHAEAPARAFPAGFVAQVSGRGTDAVVAARGAPFRLSSEYEPRGDQPGAIADLTRVVSARRRHAVLRGVTGSGKPYTMANLIANVGRVAPVSGMYGIGAPEPYKEMHLALREGESVDRDEIMRRLVAVQYERNDYDFHRGTFRVRGDVVEIFPANEESHALRVELWGDVV